MTMADNGSTHIDPRRRHDFVLVFDALDSNPNGDPDAGNLPRTDPETGQGLVTDVALKRKVRNYVSVYETTLADDDPARERLKIYVEEAVALNERHERAFSALGKKGSKTADPQARAWMCDNFYDIRMFGGVLSTKDLNCGQVQGPVQVSFARSVDPVFAHDISITRVAVTRTEDLEKERTMGRKALLPYGVYVAHGTYSAHRAVRSGRRSDGTGADADDLQLLWTAMASMWDIDVSAARSGLATRALHVFSHENPLGDAPRHTLFGRVTVARKEGVSVPRSYDDYEIDVDTDALAPVVHTQLV